MEKKMTKKEYFAVLAKVVANSDMENKEGALAFIAHEVELLEKKSAKSGQTKTQKENAEILVKIKAELEEEGFTVNTSKYRRLPHPQIQGHTNAISRDFLDNLKKTVPEVEDFQFVFDPTKIYCVNSDFTIILSE